MESKNNETKKQVIPNRREPKTGQRQIDSRPGKDPSKKIISPKRDGDGRKVLHG
jgi:hypothetical protein